jgi:hypothetical protein
MRAVAAAVLAMTCAAAVRAQETATLTPPAAWVAKPVDAAHAQAYARVRTIGKWTPAKKPTDKATPPGAIYFAVGDSDGADVDGFAGRLIAAIRPLTLRANTRVKLCGDTDLGWLLEYDDRRARLSIERVVGVHDVVVAIGTYERPIGSPEDPLARAALLTLCAASEPSP